MVGHMNLTADIVPVKCNIQLPVQQLCARNFFSYFIYDPVRQEYTPGLYAYKNGFLERRVGFQELVRQPLYGQGYMLMRY